MFKEPVDKIKWMLAGLATLGVIAFDQALFQQDTALGLFLLLGLGLGYIESRSEVGIASGYTDFFIRGSRTRLYGLLMLFGLGALGAIGIHYYAATNGAVPEYQATSSQAIIPGTSAVSPVNFGLILGSFLFGVGMTINEGCGLGTLRNTGQGKFRYLWTLIFLLIGTIPGQFVKYQLDQSRIHEMAIQVYFPNVLGYGGTIIFTGVILTLLVFLARKYEEIRRKKDTYLKTEQQILIDTDEKDSAKLSIKKIVKKQWPRLLSVTLITILLLLALIVTGEKLAVTQPLLYPAVAIFQNFGFSFDHPAFSESIQVVENGLLNNTNTLQNFGIIIGALLFALTSTNLSFSWSMNWQESGWYMLSGLLMGFGAILASGCIVGALYSGIVNFSLSGWVAFASMSLGIYVTVKLMNGQISTIPKIKK